MGIQLQASMHATRMTRSPVQPQVQCINKFTGKNARRDARQTCELSDPSSMMDLFPGNSIEADTHGCCWPKSNVMVLCPPQSCFAYSAADLRGAELFSASTCNPNPTGSFFHSTGLINITDRILFCCRRQQFSPLMRQKMRTMSTIESLERR